MNLLLNRSEQLPDIIQPYAGIRSKCLRVRRQRAVQISKDYQGQFVRIYRNIFNLKPDEHFTTSIAQYPTSIYTLTVQLFVFSRNRICVLYALQNIDMYQL